MHLNQNHTGQRPPVAAFGICGSFCTLESILPVMRTLRGQGWDILPVMSGPAGSLDTRFGTASFWRRSVEQITGHPVLDSLTGVEPLGPRGLADVMIAAPCTGTTLARLDLGLSDTPVTLAAKSLLRIHKPVVVAVSTNDGLGASAPHIAALLNRKDFYFVPFGQDDPVHKPSSLKADLTRLPETLQLAMQGRQIQPVLAL